MEQSCEVSIIPKVVQAEWEPPVALKKFLIFDFYQTDQSTLNDAIARYSQMRNYFAHINVYSPIYIVANTVAVAGNATSELHQFNISKTDQPSILPGIQMFEMSRDTVYSLWQKYKEYSYGRLLFVRDDNLANNFMYCGVPNTKLVQPWHFKILTNAFDERFWFALGVAMTFLSGLIYLGHAARNFQRKSMLGVISGTCTVCLSLVSMILAFGPSILIIKRTKPESWLISLWMVACLVIVNYYSGTVVSNLIKPPSDEAMTMVEQTAQLKYSLVFEDINHLKILNATVQKLARAHSPT